MFASQTATGCTCVNKWGWRGFECNTDVNECALQQSANAVAAAAVGGDGGGGVGEEALPPITEEEAAADLVISQMGLSTLGHGGCGEGVVSTANCINTYVLLPTPNSSP